MFIDRVTMTGADDSVRPENLSAISEAYPDTEWGILLSRSQVGNHRFPSFEWIELLKEENAAKPMRLCGHLCGSWVREILKGKMTVLEEVPGLLDMFQRIQLNFHAFPHDFDPKVFDLLPKGKQYIFQIEDVNDKVFDAALASGLDAVPLFDTSGGAGIVPDRWPTPKGELYCGYAGGLGPATMRDQLWKIGEVVPDGQRIWIDMERKIRSEDDSLFDLFKVNTCLSIVAETHCGFKKSIQSVFNDYAADIFHGTGHTSEFLEWLYEAGHDVHVKFDLADLISKSHLRDHIKMSNFGYGFDINCPTSAGC